ncbi:MAG: hypothetical protein RR539_00735 [Clostridium sp.]|uniref:hypothetical protein n=1 Tax=Clostridium sp. TaxID=1506 RepID=UPI002FCA7379
MLKDVSQSMESREYIRVRNLSLSNIDLVADKIKKVDTLRDSITDEDYKSVCSLLHSALEEDLKTYGLIYEMFTKMDMSRQEDLQQYMANSNTYNNNAKKEFYEKFKE